MTIIRSDRSSKRSRRALLISSGIGAVAALALIIFGVRSDGIISNIDAYVYDIFTSHNIAGEPTDKIVLIDIDERSLSEIGQWSWPRFQIARVFDTLAELGASAICADYVAADLDRMSPALWREKISSGLGISVDVIGVPDGMSDFDEIFARTLRSTPTVMGVELLIDELDLGADFRTMQILEIRDDGARPLIEYLDERSGILKPAAPIARAARLCGAMNAVASSDGIFRAAPAFLAYDGSIITSLWLTSLAVARRVEMLVVEVAPDGPRMVHVGDLKIPIDSEGYMYLSFRPLDRPFKRISVADVASGRVSRGDIEGRIAVFGSSAQGLQDLRPTPADPDGTSLTLIAAALDTAISGRAITRPRNRIMARIIDIIAVSTICVLSFTMLAPRTGMIISLSLIAASWGMRQYLFSSAGFVDTPLFSIAATLFQSLQAFTVRYLFDKAERQLVRSAFDKYVSPEIVDSIIDAGGVDALKGETREISVLMTDIRDFTPLSERMDPQRLVAMMNAYFTPMTKIVRDSRGTLDKYIGDALLAFWNAPLNVERHQLAAVSSLMEMRRVLGVLNDDLERDFGVRLSIGGGVHSGPAQIGNMGTHEMVSYTAIGDTINTASRLEGMCKRYSRPVVVSESAAEHCRDAYRLIQLDAVRLKGKSEPMRIYTVLERADANARGREIDDWESALALYMKGSFSEARRGFAALAEAHPSDGLYGMFALRADEMIKNAPSEWDGTFAHSEK